MLTAKATELTSHNRWYKKTTSTLASSLPRMVVNKQEQAIKICRQTTCLKRSPSVFAILAQCDLLVTRSVWKTVLQPGQTHLFCFLIRVPCICPESSQECQQATPNNNRGSVTTPTYLLTYFPNIAGFDMGDMGHCPGRKRGGGGIIASAKKVASTHAAPTLCQRILGIAWAPIGFALLICEE